MNKHTKGPWKVLELTPNHMIIVTGKETLAAVYKYSEGVKDIRGAHGNALLIAAAPDLLKELRVELTKRCGKGAECEVCGGDSISLPYHADCCAKARAAIVKAEGREEA